MSQPVNLTFDQLKELMATMAAEMKKPAPPSEKELTEIQLAQQQRKDNAESVKQAKVNKRWFQENGCTHEHKKSAGGGTHCVFVLDNGIAASPGYVYCQKCEGRFRPDEPVMRKLDPEAIFDTGKFNLLLQDCVQTGAEMFG